MLLHSTLVTMRDSILMYPSLVRMRVSMLWYFNLSKDRRLDASTSNPCKDFFQFFAIPLNLKNAFLALLMKVLKYFLIPTKQFSCLR